MSKDKDPVSGAPRRKADHNSANEESDLGNLKDDNFQNTYCYSPLSEQGSIRLLRLMPHKEKKAPIQCQLFEYPLQEQGEGTHLYEALSYVWGSEDNRQPIFIQSDDESDCYPTAEMKQGFDRRSCPPAGNNRRLFVKANLHTALSHLRDRLVERIIWIDAICINQENKNEKEQQVQSMAKIYAGASRVIVWLGERADDSDQALIDIRKAAEEQHTNSAIDEINQQEALPLPDQQPTNSPINKTNQQAVVTLLERPWFQRIWVLQEVAAAQHVLIKCGRMEIDGYAFCAGLSALKSYGASLELQSLIRSVAYLIIGVFRSGYKTSSSGGFSLYIRPLSELVDMYHTRKTTERLDKVYALLGMSSDDPSTARLLPNYKSSWKEVFQKLVNFSLSDQMSVDTWDMKEVAVIKGKGRVLGEVSSVKRDDTRVDRQSVGITWRNAPSHFDTKGRHTKGRQSSLFTFPASAKPIQVGDAVCLLQGASKPSIVRPRNGYSAVIMIAAPLTDGLQTTSFKRLEPPQLITTFPNDLLLVWDWDVSRSKSQDGEDYEYFMSSRGVPKCPRTECQDYLDKATRLWDFGLLLNGLERYEEAGKNLRKAVEVYGTALRSVDNSHGPWREADEEVLRVMNDLLIEDKSAAFEEMYKDGQTPLSRAAAKGHEAFVRLLLEKGAHIEAADNSGRTPLWWAAANGHEAVVWLLLEKGAYIEAADYSGRMPLWWAAANGHEAVVWLLLEKGAYIEAADYSGRMPLLRAAANGHEAVVRLLLEKGAYIKAKDINGQTPLLWAAANGHKAVVRLLLEKGAYIEAADNSGRMPLWWAAANGHEAVVRLLLEKGAYIKAKDINGQTLLLRAAANGHEAVVRLLLEKGAYIKAKDINGQTPLLWAAANGHGAVVRLLLEKGAYIEAKDINGQTPLLWAAANGHGAVVRLLLEKGAYIEAADNSGRMPLWWAAAKGHGAVVRLLQSHCVQSS